MNKYRSWMSVWIAMVMLLIATPSISYAQSRTSDNVWVSVRLFDGGGKGSFVDYYGSMPKTQFDGIVNNTKTNGFFRLDATSWFDDRKTLIRMQDAEVFLNQPWGYGNTAFFRIEGITRIVLLDKAFVEKNLLPLANKKQQE